MLGSWFPRLFVVLSCSCSQDGSEEQASAGNAFRLRSAFVFPSPEHALSAALQPIRNPFLQEKLKLAREKKKDEG